MKNIEVLMSTMNIKSKDEFEEKINKANITTNILIVNQVEKEEDKINITKGNKKIYSYVETGVSNSRNKLLKKATGDICIFADDDMVYSKSYEDIINEEYSKNKKADGILFYVENKNKNREKNKKIGNKKLKSFDVMRARIYGLSLKKETLEKINRLNIKFDENFGPGGKYLKGEETIFMKELLEKRF